jgi:hypothetical protein
MDEINIETKSRSRYTKRITFTMRLDEGTYNAILKYAEANHVSKSMAIRELIQRGANGS